MDKNLVDVLTACENCRHTVFKVFGTLLYLDWSVV